MRLFCDLPCKVNKASLWPVVGLQLFQLFKQDLAYSVCSNGLQVFNLISGEKLVVTISMSTIGTMAGPFAFYARAKHDLEISKAIRIWTLPTCISLLVSR